jgi:hypothetical protein
MKKPSWLTTVFGILSAVGTALAHYGTGTVAEVGLLASVVGTALLGTTAADASSVKS